MTATYVGSMSIGAATPAAATAAQVGFDGVSTSFDDINARVAALQASMAALATMPPLPSFGDMQARAVANLASITLAISTPGLPPPPSILTAIAALLEQVEALLAMMVTLSDGLTLLADFQALLGEAGLHVIAYSGAAGSFGAETQPLVSTHAPGTTQALILATTEAATWSAMTQVFKVTP